MSEHAARQEPPGIGLGPREATREATGYWWLSLVSGIVFAGIWALMEGMADIVRAFALRRLHKEL